MKRFFALVGAVLIMSAATSPAVWAQPVAAQTSAPTIDRAREMRTKANDAIGRGQFNELTPMIKDMEAALAKPDLPEQIDGRPVILTDGPVERALIEHYLTTPEGKPLAASNPVFVDDPYPLIAHIIGLHYNELGQPEFALPALRAGWELLTKRHAAKFADTTPALVCELGVTLNHENQFDAALLLYDFALTLPTDRHDVRATAHRGRGYSLIELERLDEAEAAYQESLKLEPGNAIAKRELAYITSLNHGKPSLGKGPMVLNPAAARPGQ
jgi:tetratricopeptide (TPR) repeat protein